MRVEVDGAAVSFGDRRVFKNVSTTFASRQVTALVGPSGSGKSTLLAAIAGYQPLDEGRVTVFDDDDDDDGGAGGPPDPSLVAWIPQGSNALGTRSALDNVMIGCLANGLSLGEAREMAISLLARVGLVDSDQSLARDLSGGELQRLALARALGSGKPIILADEPSANLDAMNTAKVAEVLAEVSGEATIIVATHDPALVSGADTVIDLPSVTSWS